MLFRSILPRSEREEAGEALDLVALFGVENFEVGGGDKMAVDIDKARAGRGRLGRQVAG